MKLLHLPLDSRPVHTTEAAMLMGPGQTLRQPPPALLGTLTRPASEEALTVLEEAADAALVSVDAALYGGLVQARASDLSAEEAVQKTRALLVRLEHLRDKPVVLGVVAPRLAVTVTDPDSLAAYEALSAAAGQPQGGGAQARQQLHHNHQRLLAVVAELAAAVAARSRWRLAVYQEDCAPGGPQQALRPLLRQLAAPLGDRAQVGLGADEMAFEALGVIGGLLGQPRPPSLRVVITPPGGEATIPPFEDEPVGHTLAAKLRFMGLADNPRSPVTLWVPTHAEPLDAMAGVAGWPPAPPPPPMLEGQRLWVADTMAANGGHPGLMPALREALFTGHLGAFAALNTCANTLGVCLGMGLWLWGQPPHHQARCLAWRLGADVGYQSVVRPQAVKKAQDMGAFIWNLGPAVGPLEQFVEEHLSLWSGEQKLPPFAVSLPWGRLFEVGPGW